MTAPLAVSATLIEKHLRVLTVDIGVRLAGSEQERLAAEYAAEVLDAAGASVTLEPFPVFQRCVEEQSLEVLSGGGWRSFPCSLFSSTPGTGGRRVEAPLVFFEAPAEYARDDLSFLRGKAVVHLGCHIESRAAYRRLLEAEPAFLLFVDTRYPGTTPLADGMFPSYTKDLGAKPTLNVAFMDAWEWKRTGASAARIRVRSEARPSASQNVVADLPGSEPGAGILYCGGHHDTQADSVGADDNAVGVVTLLELARVLAGVPRRRTVRLISFGAEEQLSVGSAEYVRRHRREVETRGRFMYNVDSNGSLLGWTELNANGPDAMVAGIVGGFRQLDLYLAVTREVVPYTDQFPFAVAGVPGVWLGRRNCSGGRFFHHRPDDDMSRVSCDLLARNVQAAAAILAEWGAVPTLPFARRIPLAQRPAIRRFWKDLYGGWAGLR
jgi:carboxypeptidase Q